MTTVKEITTDVYVWINETARYNRQNPTEAEYSFGKILDVYGIGYEREASFLIKHIKQDYYAIFFLDFYIPQYIMGIEIDGGYHFIKRKKRKPIETEDKPTKQTIKKDTWFKRVDIDVKHFTNEQITTGDYEERLELIIDAKKDLADKGLLNYEKYKKTNGVYIL